MITINKQLQKDKAVSVSAIMGNRKLSQLIADGLNSPVGSSKRQKAAAVLRTFNKRRLDGQGGGLDLMASYDQSNKTSTPSMLTPNSAPTLSNPKAAVTQIPQDNRPVSVVDLPQENRPVDIVNTVGKVIFQGGLSAPKQAGTSTALPTSTMDTTATEKIDTTGTTQSYYDQWFSGLSTSEKAKWQPLYDAVKAGVGPSTFSMQVMDDTETLKKMLPGVPVEALPVGASLSRQLGTLEESLRDEFKLDQLSTNLTKLQERGLTIEDDLTSYVGARDKYVKKLDTMIDGAKKSMVESDMGNPYVAQRMNNYANYLYLMKGRQQKRYVDMVNSSINYHNQELVRAENAYKTSYTNFTNELKTKTAITEEDYTRLKTTLEEMYTNVESREETELKKQKLREEVYQAQYATILDAVEVKGAKDGGTDAGFEKAKQLIVDNIDKKDEDLKVMLLEKADGWKLTATDINALIEAIERPKPENFSEDWFKTVIKKSKDAGIGSEAIIDSIIENFDNEELFKATKNAGYAKWYTGDDKDIRRYIKSLM